MGKHDTPPFKMIVERGRLVPADAHDAERLGTWRNGTAVNVTFVRDGSRVMEKKWWAILGRAVKECSTPWKTSSEASEAVKLAIGVVNLTKTVGGDYLQYPKSLTELSDPELDEAVGQMIDVIYGVTGVDPEEWRKQVAHIKEDPKSPAPADDAATEAMSPAIKTVAGTESAGPLPSDEGEDATAKPEPGHGGQAASSPELSDDDRQWLVRVFTTLKAAVGPELDVLKRQSLMFKEEAAGRSTLVRAKATKIRTELERCCGDAPEVGTVQVARYLAGLIGVDEGELV